MLRPPMIPFSGDQKAAVLTAALIVNIQPVYEGSAFQEFLEIRLANAIGVANFARLQFA